jgi:hypothetical protein
LMDVSCPCMPLIFDGCNLCPPMQLFIERQSDVRVGSPCEALTAVIGILSQQKLLERSILGNQFSLSNGRNPSLSSGA